MTLEYFTDDITRLPLSMMWRIVWRTAPLVSVPLFLLFLVQRSIGWRPPANYGLAKPASLPEVRPEQVPPEVREEARPYVEAISPLGFEEVFWLNPPYIGGKQGYSLVLLNQNGYFFATVVWIRITRGPQTRTAVIFACHSVGSQGTQISTGPLAPEQWNPELIPPFHDLLPLPLGTPPADVVGIHEERVAAMKDLVCWNRDSLAAHMFSSLLRMIDFMVEKRHYIRLTPAEVARLTKDGPR